MIKKDIAIEIKNLSKDFILPHKDRRTLKSFFLNPFSRVTNEKQHALDNISFDIKKGDFFGIVGRNGSGKSTLLKCIAGVYNPTRGHIKVNGSMVPFIELGVGFNPELTGRENVFLNGALLGFSRTEMEAMYDEIVEFAELERFMDQKLKNYSSGMQVRLAFSIAIQAKGDILILDEVLAVGDAAFQQKCNNYFEELKSKHQTVVLVSHNMEAIKRFCTKAAYIKEGVLFKYGEPIEIADAYLMDNLLGTGREAKDELYDNEENRIRLEIVDEDYKSVKIKVRYKTKEKCFLRLSLLRNGTGLGSISSDKTKHLTGEGYLNFSIDKQMLNPGDYSVGAGLFKLSNEQIAGTRSKGRKIFVIKGKDENRTGAIKLRDTWQYEE